MILRKSDCQNAANLTIMIRDRFENVKRFKIPGKTASIFAVPTFCHDEIQLEKELCSRRVKFWFVGKLGQEGAPLPPRRPAKPQLNLPAESLPWKITKWSEATRKKQKQYLYPKQNKEKAARHTVPRKHIFVIYWW